MEQINLKQSQQILLNIAKEVCWIGEKHNIPIFMVGGTMLGAIRHKGFIPWDDDMDFGVTYNHYFEFIDILKKELPSPLRCLYYEDNSPVHSFFFKVENSNTVVDDPCLNLPLNKKIGLSIDVFPIVSCTEASGEETTHKVKKLLDKELLRVIPQNATWFRKLAKRFLNFFNFGSNIKEKRKIKSLLDNVKNGEYFCNIVSPQFWKIIWPGSTFSELERYQFDGTFFWGPRDYDAYLSKCYKNYMELPPENKRRTHLLSTYMRDSEKASEKHNTVWGGGKTTPPKNKAEV